MESRAAHPDTREPDGGGRVAGGRGGGSQTALTTQTTRGGRVLVSQCQRRKEKETASPTRDKLETQPPVLFDLVWLFDPKTNGKRNTECHVT